MKHLTEMVRQHKAGKTNGIYAVCSAHPLVLETAIRYASANQTPLLIEATSNQVDQFSGYTGMTPADFRGFVCQLADSLNFPQDALILGGDHLRPKSLVDSETLIVVYISSHPYTRQYDLGLLTELRRDRQAMRVIAIAVETDAIIEAGPYPVASFPFVYRHGTGVLLPDVRPGLCAGSVDSCWQYARSPLCQRHD